MRLLHCFGVMLLLLLCSAVQADEAADRAAIEQAASEWTHGFNARDVARMLNVATSDVVLLEADRPPITEPAAVRQAWEGAFARNSRLINQTKEISLAGDMGWRIAALTLAQQGAPLMRSSALEIWQRSATGTWKLHRQMSAGLLMRPLARPGVSEPRLDSPKQ